MYQGHKTLASSIDRKTFKDTFERLGATVHSRTIIPTTTPH